MHLCTGPNTGTDNFTGGGELYSLLTRLKPDRLIIAGDFLELWQARWRKIKSVYAPLIENLKQYDPVCIAGNHDWEIQKFSDFPFKVVESIVCKFGSKKFLIIHGHNSAECLKIRNFGNL